MLIQLEAVRGDRHVWRKLSNRIAALLTATNARLQASQRQDFCDQSAPVHHTRENIDDDESPEAQSGLLSRPVGRAVMRIEGKCHCSNISYVFHWPGDGGAIRQRLAGGQVYKAGADAADLVVDGLQAGQELLDAKIAQGADAVGFALKSGQVQGHGRGFWWEMREGQRAGCVRRQFYQRPP